MTTSKLKEIEIGWISNRRLIKALGSEEEKVWKIAKALLLKSDSTGILLRNEYGNPNEKIRERCGDILAEKGIKDLYKMPFGYKLNVGVGIVAGIVNEGVRALFRKMKQNLSSGR